MTGEQMTLRIAQLEAQLRMRHRRTSAEIDAKKREKMRRRQFRLDSQERRRRGKGCVNRYSIYRGIF